MISFDVDMQSMTIKLKPTAKRSNRLVFFDEEAQEALRRWLSARARRAGSDPALFIGESKIRLKRDGAREVVVKAAKRVGLHTPGAPLEKRFGPHFCRHFYTTHPPGRHAKGTCQVAGRVMCCAKQSTSITISLRKCTHELSGACAATGNRNNGEGWRQGIYDPRMVYARGTGTAHV